MSKPFILVEGYADRLFLMAIGFLDREINRQSGKSNVARVMETKLNNVSKNVVAVIDADKFNNSIPTYFSLFAELRRNETQNLILKKHQEKPQYLISRALKTPRMQCRYSKRVE
jgi:hypothetical protein